MWLRAVLGQGTFQVLLWQPSCRLLQALVCPAQAWPEVLQALASVGLGLGQAPQLWPCCTHRAPKQPCRCQRGWHMVLSPVCTMAAVV